MTRGAVVALGIGQCVNWGVLYYAFAILVLPLERELGVPTWAVTGAFSLALLMSAGLAPAAGRLGDRDWGPRLMVAGGLGAAALLVAWTFTSGVPALYLVWAALGVCMAAALYEPAFVIVGRAFDDPARRLRALAVVTLFGGLASTVFLPGTAYLADALGWRGAVRVLAALVATSTVFTSILAFRRMRVTPPGPGATPPAHAADTSPGSARFPFVAASFAFASLASAGFAANLVPALGDRGASPSAAALMGGLMGAMQLPGRALLMHGALNAAPARLVAASLLLHGLGLAMVAAGPSMLVIGAGTMVFAAGAGLTTLVRPHLVQTLFSTASSGHLNGRLARHQQLARAAGPLAIAWLGGGVGYGAAFGVLAAAFVLLALACEGVLSRNRGERSPRTAFHARSMRQA